MLVKVSKCVTFTSYKEILGGIRPGSSRSRCDKPEQFLIREHCSGFMAFIKIT